MSKTVQELVALKQSRISSVPEGWSLSLVGDACRIRDELRFPISESDRRQMKGSYPYYGPTGIVDYINTYRIEGSYALIGEDGDHFLKFIERPMTQIVHGKFNVNNHAHIIEGTDECSVEWFSYYFMHRDITHILSRQGAGRYKLTKMALEKLPILLPLPDEQHRIADILSTWDRAINLTTQLIAAKQQYKRGLMQQLLTGKRRFKKFSNKAWTQKRLGDLLSERREIGWSKLPLLSITSKAGVVSRDSVERRDTSAEDKSKYLRICKGDIGYNTMRMWQGVSAVSNMEGIVSPAYTICIPSEEVDAHFMGHLFKFPPTIHLFFRHSQGLVDDTLSLKFDAFSKIVITVPCLDEQKYIADVLDTCDQELSLLERKLTLLKKQKQGLMQQLLTGRIRVQT
jgi:type I restriction enzyme, S subunit